MFKKFQTQQMTLQQKQMQGQELTDDEIKEIQELAQKNWGHRRNQELDGTRTSIKPNNG